jgi:hypothetical protein
MDDNENIPRYRPGKVIRTGKALTPTETTELRRLFDLAANTCDAAGQVLGRAGPPPVGADLERLAELNERIDTLVDRIKAILGQVT